MLASLYHLRMKFFYLVTLATMPVRGQRERRELVIIKTRRLSTDKVSKSKECLSKRNNRRRDGASGSWYVPFYIMSRQTKKTNGIAGLVVFFFFPPTTCGPASPFPLSPVPYTSSCRLPSSRAVAVVGCLSQAAFPIMSAEVRTPAVGVHSQGHKDKRRLQLFNTIQRHCH